MQHRFGKSEAMVIKQAGSKGFSHGFLDSTLREPCVFVGRKRLEFDVYTLQSQDPSAANARAITYRLVISQ